MKQGILFDLDGTLWNSAEPVIRSWNQTLQQLGDCTRSITVEDMKRCMGKTADQIAAILFPALPPARALAVVKTCCKEELGYLAAHGGTLYPQVRETLTALAKEVPLFIVSNCEDGYIETFLAYYGFEALITDTECPGRTGKPKGENIQLILQRNQITQAVYVGDTQTDYEAATYAGVPFIHAAYGFGAVAADVPRLAAISELPALVATMLGKGGSACK